jgi:hypothetical protein
MKIVNLVGQKFGKLTVTEKTSSTRGGSILWKCLCDCGAVYHATTRHLNRKENTVRSCGCNQIKSGKSHKQWSGFGDISGSWWASHIKHSANCKTRKHIDVTLTIEEAWNLFLRQEQQCAMTGLKLEISNDSGKNTASLDRIDNTQGYHLDNVRWVHKDINMMKRVYTDDYFRHLCQLVTLYIKDNTNETRTTKLN